MYIQSTRELRSKHSNAVAVIMSHCTDNHPYASLNGLTSGIPTRTTPTLTPTTLKNIEESFLDLQTIPPAPIEHQRQAGFVPPVVNLSTPVTCYSSDSNSSYASSMAMKHEDSQWMPSCMQTGKSSSGTGGSTRKTGGRRAHRDDKLTPEEEERKRVRRERNKLAAARCRKRRVDHTNTLLVETEGLEEKRANLQSEIQLLTHQKEELEFLLEAHQPTCKIKGQLKSNSGNNKNGKTSAVRPSSLALSNSNYSNVSTSSINKRKTPVAFPHNIPISTPSGGMFNFDALMDSEAGFCIQVSTGLTPVSTGLTPIRSTSCADQQRYSNGDLSSPENVNPPKLVSL